VGTVATIEEGTGPPVVLVHGLNGFKEGWGPLPAAIAAAGMRAVMIDLPGSGASPRLARGRTHPHRLAAVIEALAERLGPLAVLGHSLGAQVALLVAASRPAAVRRLVLVSPWVLPRPRRMPPRGAADLLQTPVIGPPLGRLLIRVLRAGRDRRAGRG